MSSKINLIINGHDHIASLFTYDDLPVLVSGAVFESLPAPAFSYQQDGGGYVLTKWVNNEGYYWVKLLLNNQKDYIELEFIRTDIQERTCKMIIQSRKIFRNIDCFRTGSTGDSLL